MIITELATNSLEHTGGACRLALWQHNGHVVCEVSDGGRLDDPLAGQRTPARGEITGRGLFLINTIADLVRTHTTAAGTTIQAYLRLPEVNK
jgi:anti-sigma regulatory factor (Ser/Thr protein kinase)